MDLNKLLFRENINTEDIQNVSDILISTNFFNQEEIKIACELVEEALKK